MQTSTETGARRPARARSAAPATAKAPKSAKPSLFSPFADFDAARDEVDRVVATGRAPRGPTESPAEYVGRVVAAAGQARRLVYDANGESRLLPLLPDRPVDRARAADVETRIDVETMKLFKAAVALSAPTPETLSRQIVLALSEIEFDEADGYLDLSIRGLLRSAATMLGAAPSAPAAPAIDPPAAFRRMLDQVETILRPAMAPRGLDEPAGPYLDRLLDAWHAAQDLRYGRDRGDAMMGALAPAEARAVEARDGEVTTLLYDLRNRIRGVPAKTPEQAGRKLSMLLLWCEDDILDDEEKDFLSELRADLEGMGRGQVIGGDNG